MARTQRAKWIVAGLAMACTGGAYAMRLGAARHARATARLQAQLLRRAPESAFVRASAGSLADLPPPVARYFRHVLPQSRQPIRVVRYKQRGTLRTDTTAQRWMPFSATQIVVPSVRGFLWDARVEMAPALHLQVLDSYIDGQGSGRVSLLSAFRLGESSGGVEMNAGSLLRYLAEAVWYPTALLPEAGVQWEAIDAQRARATLTHAGITVSLEFRFNAAGEAIAVYTPGRWGSFKSGFEMKPWEGHFSRYQRIAGMSVPVAGEVGWYEKNQWQVVWKGEITDIAYEFAANAANTRFNNERKNA